MEIYRQYLVNYKKIFKCCFSDESLILTIIASLISCKTGLGESFVHNMSIGT